MKLKLTLLCLICHTMLWAQTKPTPQWVDQKFSMFIHFGLYSVYGGVYDGEPVRQGYSEQIQSFAGIFSDWYAQTAQQFSLAQWNPDSIVALAKEAGMKSIVFTSKHHDGFCMYHSQYTPYNIVEATPYGKDAMKQLADACKRGGIGFGVYFSLIDWNYPHAYPISSHNADPLTEDHYQFNLKQVEEIMTNYGDISEIWFDMGSLTPAQSKGLYELVNKLQPHCMISGRLGNDYVDFSVMADNEYPNYKMGVPWQTAASMFDETWGYRSWQQRGSVSEKVREKIEGLVKVISRGGNYLLNIGPKGDGSVVDFEADVLKQMGRWTSRHAEAIYGTQASPFAYPFAWGEVTATPQALYLFVRSAYHDKSIHLTDVSGNVLSATNLTTSQSCEFSQNNTSITVDIPQHSAESNSPFVVIKLLFENDGYSILPDDVIRAQTPLTAQQATPLFGHSSLNYYAGYKSLIGYTWHFSTAKKQLTPTLYFTDSDKGKQIQLDIDNSSHTLTLQPTRTTIKKLNSRTVSWGTCFTKPGRGVFGFVQEENSPLIDVDTDSTWQIVTADLSQTDTLTLQPRQSRLFLQQITSTKAQTIAVEVESGNALYVLLNGKYITAHFSPERTEHNREIILLPLQKGNNQLVMKVYNGYNTFSPFAVRLLSSWNEHSMVYPSVAVSHNNYHTLQIKRIDTPSKVSPALLHNINIKL